MKIVVVACPGGLNRSLYQEQVDLSHLGPVVGLRRASHVEPDPEAPGLWTADMRPSGGPLAGPFTSRSEALEYEKEWLEQNHIPETGENGGNSNGRAYY